LNARTVKKIVGEDDANEYWGGVKRHTRPCSSSSAVRFVRGEYAYGTVLCGDDKAIDGAICDRARIRFRTNAMGSRGFFVGFVHSKADAIDLNAALGRSSAVDDGTERNRLREQEEKVHQAKLNDLELKLNDLEKKNRRLSEFAVSMGIDPEDDRALGRSGMGTERNREQRAALERSGNREHSVGICVINNNFFLNDKENHNKELASGLSSDIAFPVSAQQWLVEFDFVAHSLCLFLRMPTQWVLATKLAMHNTKIIPAFSLCDESDEIEIV